MSDTTSTPLPPLPPRDGLRRRVLAGEPVVGAWVNLGSLASAELVARAGFDWAVMDLEHGMGSDADLHAQMLAGADGLVVPRIDTAAQAAEALRWMRYPPAGIRGVALPNRGGGYLEVGHAELAARVNERLLGVFQIESPEAVAAADEIAALDGVDVLFVGPADLSHAMGIPGQVTAPAFSAALDAVAAACRAHGKAAGILLPDASGIPAHLDRGYTFLGVGSDTGWVVAGARAQAAAARAALG
jgi:4-hydroxy-2-oxoheptanedioate aldolase